MLFRSRVRQPAAMIIINAQTKTDKVLLMVAILSMCIIQTNKTIGNKKSLKPLSFSSIFGIVISLGGGQMRNIPCIVTLAAAAILFSAGYLTAAEIKFEILESSRTIQGNLFPAGTRIEYTGSGAVNYAILETPGKIQEIPCLGWVYFYESGKIKNAELAKELSLYGMKFGKGSILHLYESGKVRSGILADGKLVGEVRLGAGSRIFLSESGNLSNVDLAQNQEIQGITCAPGQLYFYEDGRLKRAVLAEDEEIGRIKFPSGSEIELYKSGRIKRVALSQDMKIEGKTYNRGSRVNFGEDGKILPVI